MAIFYHYFKTYTILFIDKLLKFKHNNLYFNYIYQFHDSLPLVFSR